ncbi:MAG: hypothetical protein H6677_18925 [Candidatus Obscuribacterales bacterium]|nr:hypothetical protein [Candidatus Obscuribacterales bacterium]
MKNKFRPYSSYPNARPFRRYALVGLLLVALIASFNRQALAFSVYGMPLSKAYSKDFFQFFKFRVVGVSITDDGFMEIIFKPPKGDPRRTSVKLSVVLEKEGQIKRMRMELGRAFIDDARQSMFARDYAKSFIQAGVHEDDYGDARPIVNEIFFRQKLTPIDLSGGSDSLKKGEYRIFKLGEGKLTSGDIIIIGDGANIPTLPDKESDMYRCFIGKSDACSAVFSKSSVHLKNFKVNGNQFLAITVAPRDYKELEKKDSFDFHAVPLFIP